MYKWMNIEELTSFDGKGIFFGSDRPSRLRPLEIMKEHMGI